MIEKVEIISQPYSGEYKERIYDIESPWNSSNWTWIKFTNEVFSEWCGQFRGSPIGAGLSKKNAVIIILTSDYLYQLDINNANLIKYEDQPQYNEITISSNENFILSDYYNLYKISNDLKDIEVIKSPIDMDDIKFRNWNSHKLEFTCEEFGAWSNEYLMEYNCLNSTINIIEKLK